MEKPNWEHIVRGCKDGNPFSQKEAYRHAWRLVYPSVYRLIRNQQEAEDVMHEAFIKGFKKLGELQKAESYPGWQKRICVNEAISFLRKRNQVHLEDLSEREAVPHEDTDWTDEQLELAVRKLEQLPIGYQTIIKLYLHEDYTHEEIAKNLGITASASRSQYSRGLKKLKELILHEQVDS